MPNQRQQRQMSMPWHIELYLGTNRDGDDQWLEIENMFGPPYLTQEEALAFVRLRKSEGSNCGYRIVGPEIRLDPFGRRSI